MQETQKSHIFGRGKIQLSTVPPFSSRESDRCNKLPWSAAACKPVYEGMWCVGHVFPKADPRSSCGQLTRKAECLQKGNPSLGRGQRWVGARSTVAHKRISPPHKDSGPLLSLTRSTKEMTFVCLGGRRGCVRTVQPGVGGGGGATGGATMTEGVDEMKTQDWPPLFATASSFTGHLWSSPMGCLSVYLLHGPATPPTFTHEPLMAPLARPFQPPDSAIHLLPDQWTLRKTD